MSEREKLTAAVAHFFLGCAGYADHEIDAAGVTWIGLRCTHCGRLKAKSLSAYQRFPAGRLLLQDGSDG